MVKSSPPSPFGTALLVVLALLPQAAEGQGGVKITPFTGASIQLEHDSLVIHIDPWSGGDYSNALPADLILITDTSADHLDPDLIRALRKPGTPVILSDRPDEARDEGSRERLLLVPDGTLMENGDRLTLAGVAIEAVPMYDIIPGEPFHARGEGNGYILAVGGIRIYVAGVTECVPEIQTIRDIDVAFIPMNLPHGRMPPSAAAECVKMIQPAIVYPYHYREQSIDEFVAALEDEPVEVRVHDWYPAGP
jgi:L-ascorbate metabolism protein UlaG (beta-lactamase superfamily)